MKEKIIETGKNSYFNSEDFAVLTWEMLETKYPEETKEIMEEPEIDIFKVVNTIEFLIVFPLQLNDKLVLHEHRWNGYTYVVILKTA
jgi:hypothetical protein